MWPLKKSLTSKARRDGFTIVELLVVIVIIGILATLTLVSYGGITQRAHLVALQSDLSGAAKQLGIDNTTVGSYPGTVAGANNGLGLKASPGTTWQYTYTSSSNTYCLTGTNNSVSYFVSTANQTPQAGACPGHVNGGDGSSSSVGVVITLAGDGVGSFANGTGTATRFNGPSGVTVDSSGNIYVADAYNHRIRKITPAGVVTTFAGSGTAGSTDGTGTAAQFSYPRGVTVDSSGNVYVAENNGHRIRKITPAGVVTTLAGSTQGYADGTGTAAQFYFPYGIAIDSSSNIYVADTSNHRIRKITPAGVVTTFAGSGTAGSTDGTGTAAQFYNPYGIAIDSSSNIYVADTSNHRIRKITPAGVVMTFAGSGTAGSTDGTGTAAQFYDPYGIVVDSSSNVYVADTSNHRIRKITPAGVVMTFAGSAQGYADGTGTAAQFYRPTGVAVDSSGSVYVGDTNNHRIRKIQ